MKTNELIIMLFCGLILIGISYILNHLEYGSIEGIVFGFIGGATLGYAAPRLIKKYINDTI